MACPIQSRRKVALPLATTPHCSTCLNLRSLLGPCVRARALLTALQKSEGDQGDWNDGVMVAKCLQGIGDDGGDGDPMVIRQKASCATGEDARWGARRVTCRAAISGGKAGQPCRALWRPRAPPALRYRKHFVLQANHNKDGTGSRDCSSRWECHWQSQQFAMPRAKTAMATATAPQQGDSGGPRAAAALMTKRSEEVGCRELWRWVGGGRVSGC